MYIKYISYMIFCLYKIKEIDRKYICVCAFLSLA